MNKWWMVSLLWLVCGLWTSCQDDEYHYPSVKLEYLTAYSDGEGKLLSVVTDAGEYMDVAEDGTGLSYEPGTASRIVTNYEKVVATDGSEGARLYAGIFAIAPEPLPANEFEEGIHTDPADVLSIWPGLNYLNIILTVKAQDGKHVFHFIEDQVTEATDGYTDVYLTLYHDDGDDIQAYTQRAYLSVPLQKYLSREGLQGLNIHFSLHTSSDEVKTYDIDYYTSLLSDIQ